MAIQTQAVMAAGEPVSERPSLTAQITELVAAGKRPDDILDLAVRQRQAASDELYAARLVAEDATIPGTEPRSRWLHDTRRAAALRAAATLAAVVIEEPPPPLVEEPDPASPPPED